MCQVPTKAFDVQFYPRALIELDLQIQANANGGLPYPLSGSLLRRLQYKSQGLDTSAALKPRYTDVYHKVSNHCYLGPMIDLARANAMTQAEPFYVRDLQEICAGVRLPEMESIKRHAVGNDG